MDPPLNVGVGGRYFRYHLPVAVEPIEAETGGLALDPASAVLEPALRDRVRARHLRTEKPFVGAIADAGDADGGVDDDASRSTPSLSDSDCEGLLEAGPGPDPARAR